ncbi:MAG: helix-turn-helix domain-containing protein [Lysobacterales bacterium]
MDIEKIAKAIEADAGQPLPELRGALGEAQGRQGRITTAEQIMVRAARARLGLSQAEFGTRIGTPVATLRDWEQGRFALPGAVRCLLRLLIAHSELSSELEAA